MSEWTSVLIVFWALWLTDVVRLAPRRVFTLVSSGWRARRGAWTRARITYARLSRPGARPGSWQMTASDPPFAFSPTGLCNQNAGAAGRPAEAVWPVQAFRWEDVRDVGVARGWIYINGLRFCPDSGHVRAPELLSLARLPPLARETKLCALLDGWFRPAHLRRRARVLVGRTAAAATLNGIAVVLLGLITAYVAGDVASRLPERWSMRFAEVLPWLLLALLAIHVLAVVIAWRALRRLKPVLPEKRGSALFSALLLPPHALRLRAVLADGFFPAQHPVAAIAAFGGADARARWGYHSLSDLRWPVADADAPLLAREIVGWFRAELEPRVLRAAGSTAEALLGPPEPNSPASCSYCPRCRDQFVAGPTACPHGVPLQPFRRPASNHPAALQ